jgi:hypothetical protein
MVRYIGLHDINETPHFEGLVREMEKLPSDG